MASPMAESPVFIMDSGPFIDVIPTLLYYLDLQSLVKLAQTCHFWKHRIYTDIKLWPKLIELPYIGSIDNDAGVHNTFETALNAKLWSMIQPPEDPAALEKVLQKMASSEDSIKRFALVKEVNFKNFLHTDESLRLTALLFPSIEQISFEGNLLSILGIQHIAMFCNKLKHIEFYQCITLNIQEACRLFHRKEYQENLERIFIYHGCGSHTRTELPSQDDVPFMALCQQCGLYFNELKNEKEKLCLYHPGTYSGYGHSCSSYSCCGSGTPRYPSTLGCQYDYHKKFSNEPSLNQRYSYELHDGHPEYMFKRYTDVQFPLSFTQRRQLKNCYQKWNKAWEEEEE